EIFRRDIQFLDVGGSEDNRHLMSLVSEISRTLGFRSRTSSQAFAVYRVNQRAIGELMISSDSKPGERWCIGYAEFCRKISEDAEFSRWIRELIRDLDIIAGEPEVTQERMIRLQRQLINLIDFLDPQGVRFPVAERAPFDRDKIVRQLSD